MTLDDFDRIEPEEFDEVCRAWNRTQVQDSWERARFLARCCLQPHCKQSLKATDVCRFPWDKERTESRPAAESTRERFEELVRRTESRKENPNPAPPSSPVPVVAERPENDR